MPSFVYPHMETGHSRAVSSPYTPFGYPKSYQPSLYKSMPSNESTLLRTPLLSSVFCSDLSMESQSKLGSIESVAYYVPHIVFNLLVPDNLPCDMDKHPFALEEGRPEEDVEKMGLFKQFVDRVLSATHLSASVVLLSLKYIHRLGKIMPLVGNRGSQYRIWLTSMMLADVYLNDNSYTTKSWSDVTGFSIEECVTMRREYLNALGFDLYTSPLEYQEWLGMLEAHLATQQRPRTGHLYQHVMSPIPRSYPCPIYSVPRPSSDAGCLSPISPPGHILPMAQPMMNPNMFKYPPYSIQATSAASTRGIIYQPPTPPPNIPYCTSATLSTSYCHFPFKPPALHSSLL